MDEDGDDRGPAGPRSDDGALPPDPPPDGRLPPSVPPRPMAPGPTPRGIIPDAPVGFVSTIRPTSARWPLVVAGLLVLTAIGLAAFVIVRSASEPGTPWAERSPQEQRRNLGSLCERGSDIDGAIPHIAGAELQAGIVIDADEEIYGSPFSLAAASTDASEEEYEMLAFTQITMAVCVDQVDVLTRTECEARPGEMVETVTEATYEVRYVELRTAEEIDLEEVTQAVAACPGSFNQGISDAIEAQTSGDLLDQVEGVVREGARQRHIA